MVINQVENTTTQLERSQIDTAGHVLARALFDDPASKYYLPNDANRAKLLPHLYNRVLNYGLLYEEVYVTPGAVDGAAVWMKPGHDTIPLTRMIRSGLLGAYLRTGFRPILRALSLIGYGEKERQRHVPGDHWYLFLIGVDPRLQSQGIGSQLIEPILVRADNERLPCYLETVNPRNLAFYKRNGFHVAAEGDTPKGRLHVWFMLRKPH